MPNQPNVAQLEKWFFKYDRPSPLVHFMNTLSLFAAIEPEAHKLAFERWIVDQRESGLLRQPGSVQVYGEMWGAFTVWCLSQSPAISLETLHSSDLQAFQAARFGLKREDLSLSPRYALRFMRLIDRVLTHHAAHAGQPANRAAKQWLIDHPEVRFADASTATPLPEFLSVAEAKGLITYLSSARPRPVATTAQRHAQTALTWQEVRNRVAVALQLGAGLTPGDVRALVVASPAVHGGRIKSRPWKVTVPSDGTAPARETPVAPWAGELLHHWLQVRAEAGIPGDHLFPSTRTGKPWSKKSQYQAARDVLEAAGIERADGGSFRLRHTFALRQLRRGTEPAQVAQWLGIEPEAMSRYDRLVTAPVDVV